MNTFSDVLDKLKSAKKVAIFSHENPDGDAFGSMSAAKAILKHLGKDACVCLNVTPPEKFSYLLDEYEVLPKELDCDVALALDCGAQNRLGELSELFMSAPLKLSIDHHLSNTPFADVYYTDPECSATCELVYEMAMLLCSCVPEGALAGIYTGLSTDTGHFKFSNVTKKTMAIASELIGLGLNHREITVALYDTIKKQKLKFLGEIYSKIEFFADGKISFLYLPDELLLKYDILPSDVEELPSTILSVEGVLVGVLLKDKEGGYKVSLRGKDVVDLSVIAASFGGGGHFNASGFSIDGDKDKELSRLFSKIETALGESDYV